MKKYVILGNSIAALTAVRAIRSMDKEGQVTVVSAENHLPYSKVLLTHYIAGHVKVNNMYLTSPEEIKRLGVNVIYGTKAVGINISTREVILENGRCIAFDSVLAATGGSPVSESDSVNCISTGLRTIEDANLIIKTANSGGKILIAGGGLVGVKLACALNEAGYNAEMVIKSGHILSKVADDEAALRIQLHMQSKGICIRTGVDIERVEEDDHGRKIAVLSDGQKTECDMVVYCKGVRPNMHFIDKSACDRDGIITNKFMMAQMPGIYAAGDVACTMEITENAYHNISIWPNAVEQGRIAGLNMAGGKYEYRGSLSRNSLEILGLPFIRMGITNAKGAQKELDYEIESENNTYKKLVYRKGKMVGALLLGDVYEAGRLQSVIRENNKKLT
ncbi:MAG: NAD(P)/FAD-dependent oxidoreductase [Caulobacteraceae bacterium]